MRGGHERFDIVVTPMVALTVKLSTTIEEFYGANVIANIALLLQVSICLRYESLSHANERILGFTIGAARCSQCCTSFG